MPPHPDNFYIFSRDRVYVFTLFMVSFNEWKFLILILSNLSIFPFKIGTSDLTDLSLPQCRKDISYITFEKF